LENASSANETDQVKLLKAENKRLVEKQGKLVEEKRKLKKKLEEANNGTAMMTYCELCHIRSWFFVS
jgi:predicted nuclease with TOPRIM domain